MCVCTYTCFIRFPSSILQAIQSIARLPHPKLVPPLRGWQPETLVPLGGYPGSCLQCHKWFEDV